jgi:peptidoglycan/LPS O-acetylase OafA/YrhL
MTNQLPELRPLTAFRFFAALAVFFRHLYPWFKENPDLPWVLHCFMNDGFCGVTFFFVLSGFVLTYNYRHSFDRLTRPGLRNFYIARVARIWPVHLLTFGLALVVLHEQILEDPSGYIRPAVANLTLTQSFFPVQGIYFSFNSVSWSLSDEIFFYAMFPLILWTMRSTGLNRPLGCCVLAIGVWIGAVACVILGRDDEIGFWMWYVCPVFRLVDFLIGVALGQIFLGLKDREFRGPNFRQASLLEIGSLAFVMVAILASPSVNYLLRRSVYYTPFFAVVILVFAYQKGIISRLISGKLLRLFGEASYSFYMFHFLLIHLADRYPRVTHLGSLDPVTRSVAVFAISLLVSIACYYWFEVPARTRVRSWLTRRYGSEDRGQKTEDRGQKTEIRDQKSEDRGQKTEDRDQKSEDRGQRREDRGQRTEDRDQKSEVGGQ